MNNLGLVFCPVELELIKIRNKVWKGVSSSYHIRLTFVLISQCCHCLNEVVLCLRKMT